MVDIVLPVANAVAVAALPVVLPELPDTLPVTSPVISPANPVAVNIPVFELNVKLVPDFGPKLPVAAVANNTLHDVSVDSSATVTVVAMAAVPVVSWFNVATLAAASVPLPILSALVVSVVAPYKWLREEFKERHKVNEIYLHTTEIRGREHYFAEDYEVPTDNFLNLDTTNISIESCIESIMQEFM